MDFIARELVESRGPQLQLRHMKRALRRAQHGAETAGTSRTRRPHRNTTHLFDDGLREGLAHGCGEESWLTRASKGYRYRRERGSEAGNVEKLVCERHEKKDAGSRRERTSQSAVGFRF
jgi:hypothetical protein